MRSSAVEVAHGQLVGAVPLAGAAERWLGRILRAGVIACCGRFRAGRKTRRWMAGSGAHVDGKAVPHWRLVLGAFAVFAVFPVGVRDGCTRVMRDGGWCRDGGD